MKEADREDEQEPLGKVKGNSLSCFDVLVAYMGPGSFGIELELELPLPKLFLELQTVCPPEVASVALGMECTSYRVQ